MEVKCAAFPARLQAGLVVIILASFRLAPQLRRQCHTSHRVLPENEVELFGGSSVLERHGYRCRVCDASGRDKCSIIVHHRVPGKSVLNLMLSLCPACHAKIHRTKAALTTMPPLLLKLWREQHPKGHEQTALNFALQTPSAMPVRLFDQNKSKEQEIKHAISQESANRGAHRSLCRSYRPCELRFPLLKERSRHHFWHRRCRDGIDCRFRMLSFLPYWRAEKRRLA